MVQQHLTVGIFLFLLLFLKGCAAPVAGPSLVRASPGRSLPVVCKYNEDYYDYIKYWCKGFDWNSCVTVVKTDTTEKEHKSDRTVIQDNQTQYEFTVTVENITEQDAGIYWCAIERYGADYKSKVNITVITELQSTTIALTTQYSSTITIFSTTNSDSESNLSNLHDPLILLPVAFVALMLILGGALLIMWRLKKKKVTKRCGDTVLPTVPPPSGQASDITADVAYATVIATPAFASKPQEPAETVDYATLRFSTLNEQAIYANI